MTRGIRAVFGALGRRWWLMAFLVATLWVWQRYAVVQVGRRVASLRMSLSELVETRDALLAENATLSSHGRIEAIASARLGLQPVREQQIIRLVSNRNGGDGILRKRKDIRSNGPDQTLPDKTRESGRSLRKDL